MRKTIIRVRASDEERNNLLARAHARGMTLSELVRLSAQGVRLPVARFDQRQSKTLIRLLGQLAKIGSNLNQITRAVNSRRLTGHSRELAMTLSEIDRLRAQIRELL
jgi:mobilization protein NikA